MPVSHLDDVDARLREVEALNELIRTCEHTSRGLKTASRLVEQPPVGPLLAANARELEAFTKQLQSLVLLRGGRPARHNHTSGLLGRGAMTFLSLFPDSDDAILGKCEEFEERTERAYDRALEVEMPRDFQLVLVHHREELRHMQRTLDSVLAS